MKYVIAAQLAAALKTFLEWLHGNPSPILSIISLLDSDVRIVGLSIELFSHSIRLGISMEAT